MICHTTAAAVLSTEVLFIHCMCSGMGALRHEFISMLYPCLGLEDYCLSVLVLVMVITVSSLVLFPTVIVLVYQLVDVMPAPAPHGWTGQASIKLRQWCRLPATWSLETVGNFTFRISHLLSPNTIYTHRLPGVNYCGYLLFITLNEIQINRLADLWPWHFRALLWKCHN